MGGPDGQSDCRAGELCNYDKYGVLTKADQVREGLFYLFPLSEWQAAPTLASSLLQLDNTLQPKAGERERLIIQSLCSLQKAPCRS